MAQWDPKLYLKFQSERTQPAVDLVNRIKVSDPRKIIDIGCGPGNSTNVLAGRFPKAYILGVDNSEEMITSARSKYSELDFKYCDVSGDLSKMDHDFDIVFSNACIQWVPDHQRLIKELLGLLKKGGVLAVQIPMNFNEPIHQIISEVSSSSKWCKCFPNPRVFHTLKPGEYFDILAEASEEFTIWDTTYYHVMKSHQDIMEWYRGTGLRPYFDVLDEEKKVQFEDEILINVIERYPVQKNGEIIFRFPRLFFMASPKV